MSFVQESKFVHKQVKGELWWLKRLDGEKDKKQYGMVLLGFDFTDLTL